MSLDKIYGIAGTALNAQLTRMNLTASNLANQGTVNTTESEAFRAKDQFSKLFCRMKWQLQVLLMLEELKLTEL